jgi:predicted DCC family thiol-disulfide oxidoreductase YuxK
MRRATTQPPRDADAGADADAGEEGHGGPHLVLYDGDCGLCSRLVQFVLDHDPAGRFHFAALQSPLGRAVVARAGGDPAVLSTLYVVPRYREGLMPVFTKSDAATFIAGRLAGPWRAASWLRVLPRGLRDVGYDLVARHRHRAFGPDDQCLLPTPEERRRFIDEEP